MDMVEFLITYYKPVASNRHLYMSQESIFVPRSRIEHLDSHDILSEIESNIKYSHFNFVAEVKNNTINFPKALVIQNNGKTQKSFFD